MTLYLKYRPQTIDELDLESVRQNLKQIVSSGNIPHAFLFSGPKGTGKTSGARILAKIVNCTNLSKTGEPCNACPSCISITSGNNIDIIELDAASNRGIDDIRSLKEGISLSPTSSKKKVYIIDEAHMLTLEAANAFLKTLEEPPDHVIFILATTNPEKLPATVISRLTRVDFKKASDTDIARQINRVAKGENIKIDKDAIKKISKLADGSFRDAVKILEGLSFKTKDIKVEDLSENSADTNNFFEILTSLNAQKCLEFVENLIQNGISTKNFTDEILDNIHLSILAKNNIGEDNLPKLTIGELINLNNLILDSKKQTSPVSQLPFEIAIIKFISTEPKKKLNKDKDNQVGEIKEVKKTIDANKTKDPPTIKELLPPSKKIVKSLDDAVWQKLLENIRGKNIGMEALLRAAKPLGFDGRVLSLGVYYQFHKDRLEDSKNSRVLENIANDTFGTESVKVEYELIEKPKTQNKVIMTNEVTPLKNNADKDIIDAAKEIFG